MACKEYKVGEEWLSEATFKKRLLEGDYEKYKASGVISDGKTDVKKKKKVEELKESVSELIEPTKVEETVVEKKVEKPKKETKVESIVSKDNNGKEIISVESLKDKYPNLYEYIKKKYSITAINLRDVKNLMTAVHSAPMRFKVGAEANLAVMKELENVIPLFSDSTSGMSKKEAIDALNKGKYTDKQKKVIIKVIESLNTDRLFAFEEESDTMSNFYRFCDNILQAKDAFAFIHEVGHFSFYNILSAEDRIKFYEYAIKKFYGTGVSPSDNLAVSKNILSDDKTSFFRVKNAGDNFNEYFAEQFNQYIFGKLNDSEISSLYEKIKQFVKSIISAFRESGYDTNLDPYFSKIIDLKKLEPKLEPKTTSKKSTTTEQPTQEPKGISIGDEFTDDNRINHKVIEVNKANNTFKTKNQLGHETNFLIKEDKKTGKYYADSFGNSGTPKRIELPNYSPEAKAKENTRNVKFTEQKISEEAKKIAKKIAYKPSELNGTWSHERLTNFTEGKEGGFIKQDANEDFIYYKTLGEKMADLIKNGLMTEQEAKDITEFLNNKKKQIDANNIEIEKQILKDKMKISGAFSTIIPPVWNLIPKDVREKFIDRLAHLIINGKYALKDAIEIAKNGTLDKYLELNTLSKEDLDALNEFLPHVADKMNERISKSSTSQGAGIAKDNNPMFNDLLDGLQSFAKGTRTQKAIIDEAIEYLKTNEKEFSNELKALELDFDNGKRTVIDEDQVARIIVYKKMVTDKLNEATKAAYSDNKNKSDQELFDDAVNFEDAFFKHQEELARISKISHYTANTQSMAFNLRQYLIDENFDIVAQIAKESKARGRALTADETKELREIHAKYLALQEQLNELTKQQQEVEATEKIQNLIDTHLRNNEGQSSEGTTTEGEGGSTESGGEATGEGTTGSSTTTEEKKGQGSDKPRVDKKDHLQLTKGYILSFIEKGVTTPEDLVEAIRQNLKAAHSIDRTTRQIQDAISGYGEKTFTNPDDVEKAYRRARSILALLSKIEDAKKGIKPFPQSGTPVQQLDRQIKLKRELKEILDSMQISEQEQRTINAKKLATYKKSLNSRIEAESKKNVDIYNLQIPSVFESDKDLKGNDKHISFFTKEQAEKQSISSDQHEIMVQEAIDSGRYEQAIKNKEISAYDVVRIIESHGIVPSKEIAAAFKVEVKDARKKYKFSPTVTKRLQLDEDARQKKIELNKIREDSEYRINKILEAQYHWSVRTKNKILDVLSLPKTAMSGLDLSAPFRQGWVLLSSAPIKYLLGDKGAIKDQWKAFKAMHKFAYYADEFNPNSYEKGFKGYMDRLKQDPKFYLMKECGLDLSEATKQEEEFYGNQFANKLPLYGENLFGIFAGDRTELTKSPRGLNIPKRSEFAYSGFLNIQRVDAFNEAYNWLMLQPEFDITTKEGIATLKGVCKHINTMTGRGEVKALPETQKLLTRFFFSPKLIASRMRMLALGYDLPKGLARKYAQKQAAYFFASQAALFSITALGVALGVGGDDEEEEETIEQRVKRTGTFDEYIVGNKNVSFSYNPKSQKFLKLSIGGTAIDLTAGFGIFPRTIVQTISGEMITSSGEPIVLNDKGDERTWSTPALDYFINKGGPITGEVVDYLKRANTAETKGGGEILLGFAPLILHDLGTNMKNETLDNSPQWQKVLGTGLNIASFYGMTVNNKQDFEPIPKKERNAYKRAKRDEGDYYHFRKSKKKRLLNQKD